MKDLLCTCIESALDELCHLALLKELLNGIHFEHAPSILAIGKSAYLMAQVCCQVLLERSFRPQGFLLTKYGMAGEAIPGLVSLEAGHPTPDANSINHSQMIMDWLQALPEEQTLIVLLSGGASALFEIPAMGLKLSALIELNRYLLCSGLPITEINQIRSQHSGVKAGKAIAMIPCSQILCYAVSDVEGNDPRVIGSGSFWPTGVEMHEAGHYAATLAGNRHFKYSIVADNLILRKLLGKSLPLPVKIIPRFVNLTVVAFASLLGKEARLMKNKGTMLYGGETTVEVKGSGLGGRCTHLALLVAKDISGLNDISFLAVASDGNDNLEGISGAYVDGFTWNNLLNKGIDADAAISSFDSYTALKSVSGLVPAWHSPLNVNELYILIKK